MFSPKALVWTTLLVNVACFLVLSTLLALHSSKAGGPDLLEHTYNGHDFPDTLPVSSLGRTLMTVEESSKYPLQGLESDAEWFSMTSAGYGYVHVGHNRRIFAVTMFHEMHCMRVLNFAFGHNKLSNIHHVRHCLGYLRVMALCNPDLTLERGDFTTRNFREEPEGATHECTDFTAVYDSMQVRFDDWMNRHSS